MASLLVTITAMPSHSACSMTATTLTSRLAPMRLAMFTDIHWGARANGDQHLQDCLDYIDWFCQLVKDQGATHVAFLGDWMENRNAINVRTLAYSQEGARRLNALGLPVFFIVGNHDLYHRFNREIFSTDHFNDLSNFVLINEPLELTPELFATPFLFREEYPQLAEQINSYRYVLGHFEFKDFVVTGQTKTLDHGPDASQFPGPKYLLSGHFHKRQQTANVVYIGNTFPTSFGDAWDAARGAAILQTDTATLEFVDYPGAPLFYKTRLSEVLAGPMDFKPRGRVRCLLDADIGYSEVQALREELMRTYDLREFSVEEDTEAKKEALTDGLELVEVDLTSLDVTVRQLLLEGVAGTATIDPTTLVTLYEELGRE